MRLEWLEECVDLADTLSFTKTARNLFIAQPVLSRHIANLENELAFRIFDRSPHSVMLTDDGRQFVEDARIVVAAYQAMKENAAMRRKGAVETLTVGFLVGAARPFIPEAANCFFRTNPEILIRYRTCEMPESYQMLDSGSADLIITGIPQSFIDERYDHLVLFVDKHYLIVPTDHPLAKKESVAPADLRGETIQVPSRQFFGVVSQQIRDYLRPEQNGIFVSEELEDMNTLPLLIHSENCVGVSLGHLKEYYDDPYLRFVPLEGSNLDFTVAAVWKRSHKNDAVIGYARALKKAVEEHSTAQCENRPTSAPSAKRDFRPAATSTLATPTGKEHSASY